jgi:hypothetical protein
MAKVSLFSKLTGGAIARFGFGMRVVNAMYENLTDDAPIPGYANSDWRDRYLKMRAAQKPGQAVRWKNFVRTVQALWVIGIVGLLWSAIELSLYSGVAVVIMLLFVWLSMGYRIWVLRTGLYPSIAGYVRLLPSAPFAGLPLNAIDLLD